MFSSLTAKSAGKNFGAWQNSNVVAYLLKTLFH